MALTQEQRDAIKHAVAGGVTLLDARLPTWRETLANALGQEREAWNEHGGLDVLATIFGCEHQEALELMFPTVPVDEQEERAQRYGFALPMACLTQGTNHAEACFALTHRWESHVD